MQGSIRTVVEAFAEGAAAARSGAMPPLARPDYEALRAMLADKPERRSAMAALEQDPGSEPKRNALAAALTDRRYLSALQEMVDVALRLRGSLLWALAKDNSATGYEVHRARPKDPFNSDDRNRRWFDRRLEAAVPKGKGIKEPILDIWVAADDAEYDVWYATNRRPADPADPGKGYSAERDATVHHGSCRVFIPRSHKIGSTGSPWLRRLFTGDDRLKLRGIAALGAEDYWRGVAAQLDAADRGERHALVFIHGYNVSFEDAALRAAQIGFDLQVRGAMAFFSWPSRGRLDGYLADAATIDASEGAITDFLVGFAERSGADAVHVIAHSMGNRGVLRAVDRIAQGANRRSREKRFGQVILAAADVDADVFRQRAAAYVRLAQRTTLYVSTRDLAVEASHWLHDFPRVGLMPPVLVAPGIDTVNVANADLTRLGHGYVADALRVLQDMHALITAGTPPERRFGLRPADAPDGGGRFWVIGA